MGKIFSGYLEDNEDKVSKGDLTDDDRNLLVKIADIIEKGIEELSQEEQVDYQALLNFIMGINQEYRKYIIVKVSDKAVVPYIEEVKASMRRKQELISQKVGY